MRRWANGSAAMRALPRSGTGSAPPAWGAGGYFLSVQSLFFLTAALVVPAVFALARIRPSDVKRQKTERTDGASASLLELLSDRRLLVFAGCVLLFQLANAAMLPLMGGMMTGRSSEWASGLMGACIVVPQLVVAGCAPAVGRIADSWGRRP